MKRDIKGRAGQGSFRHRARKYELRVVLSADRRSPRKRSETKAGPLPAGYTAQEVWEDFAAFVNAVRDEGRRQRSQSGDAT